MDDSKKKISFIINPISGTQGKEQILKWLDEKLDKSRYIPEVIYTERAGHAVEIAALKAKEEAFAVVAIGGDGTINEIARSLVHTKLHWESFHAVRETGLHAICKSYGCQKSNQHHQRRIDRHY